MAISPVVSGIGIIIGITVISDTGDHEDTGRDVMATVDTDATDITAEEATAMPTMAPDREVVNGTAICIETGHSVRA